MDIEALKKYKEAKGYSYERLSSLTGVPVGTLQKIFRGETKHPREKTLSALEKALVCDSNVEENPLPFSQKRRYTIEDYYALPDDIRAELIDGRFYLMAAPSYAHQYIAGELHWQLKDQIRRKGGNCIPFLAPADVRLNCDEFTMVQPDVFLICDRSQINGRRGEGAPAFVAEILSPSSRVKDSCIKLGMYCSAGVREYWIIDPDAKTVVCHDFDGEAMNVRNYSFEDVIPLSFYQGEIQIDMREMKLPWLQDEDDWSERADKEIR